jgi:polyisoprenoid-binding protein YceI
MRQVMTAIAAFTICIIAEAQPSYILDKNHTRVGFSATHFEISHVEGRFKNVMGTFTAKKEDFSDAVIELTIDAKSLDTDVEMRDTDLKSENWFAVEKFPAIIFKSTSFKKVNTNKYVLNGNITIHGLTNAISLNVIYNGKAFNPMTKKSSVGFTITGKLSRKDFSVGMGTPITIVSNEIELTSNAEFIID